MGQLKPFMIFSGQCREALEFYRECFGGEIVSIQTFEESPLEVSDDFKNKVFNSEFRSGDVVFMASDSLPEYPTTIGTNLALFVDFPDPAAQEKVYGKLHAGGKIIFPLEEKFGMVIDRYGIQWMLACST